jgi:hypothetical protein
MGRYLSDENALMLDDLEADWTMEDCPEADLHEDFWKDMRSSQAGLGRLGITTREIGVELRPLLRMLRNGIDEEW